MLKYLIKRILLLIPALLAVVLTVFILLYLIPGSGLQHMRMDGDGDLLDRIYEKLGVEDGLFSKALRYAWNLFFKFDLGDNVTRHRVVNSLNEQMRYRWGYTFRLAGWALVVSILIGVPAGICAALHCRRWPDRTISAVTTALSSVPGYCMALLLAIVFALKLGLLPASGVSKPGAMVMPVLTVASGGIAQLCRVVRAALLETLGKNYVTALRAKGLRQRAIIWVHALRNALVPIVASLGELAGKILGGTLVAEKFFAVPGVGYFLLNAVTQREQAIILATTVSIAVVLMAINIVTDMIYLLADPQLRKKQLADRRKGDQA